MATMVISQNTRRRHVAREAKLLFAIGFVYFLIATLALRLIPRPWRGEAMPKSREKSLVAEAKEAAGAVVGFVYMH